MATEQCKQRKKWWTGIVRGSGNTTSVTTLNTVMRCCGVHGDTEVACPRKRLNAALRGLTRGPALIAASLAEGGCLSRGAEHALYGTIVIRVDVLGGMATDRHARTAGRIWSTGLSGKRRMDHWLKAGLCTTRMVTRQTTALRIWRPCLTRFMDGYTHSVTEGERGKARWC